MKKKYQCKICNSENIIITYNGKIRNGKFGNYIDNQNIFECQECKVQFYNGKDIDYQSSEYRTMIQANPSADEYYHQHDDEQLYNLEILGLNNLRNKVIADIGCGAGSFLDMVSGITKKQIAIEPFKDYQSILKEKKYDVFDYASNKMNKNKIEIGRAHV